MNLKHVEQIYVLSLLGFDCECRLHAAVFTLLPDIIIYAVYDYRMVYYHSLHRKVITFTLRCNYFDHQKSPVGPLSGLLEDGKSEER